MSIRFLAPERTRVPAETVPSPAVARGVLVGLIALATLAGFLATDADAARSAASAAGPDLTRLLRLMMGLKVVMAAAAAGAVVWRLGWRVSSGWFVAYGVAVVAMVAGPGLIWDMAHVRLGALLLHGGLAATVVLLWRDPAVARALGDVIRRRVARRTASAPFKPSRKGGSTIP